MCSLLSIEHRDTRDIGFGPPQNATPSMVPMSGRVSFLQRLVARTSSARRGAERAPV